MTPSVYNPVKTLPPVPNIYASRGVPSSIHLKEIEIDTKMGLPFILLISEVFYFTINNKYEESFQYLGKANETNKKKKAFLDAFLEANKGNKEALRKVADMYAAGYGVQENMDESIRYYRLAAKQGDLKARTVIAKYMAQGMFAGVDPGKGVELLRLIVLSNYPEAHYQLAKHLEEGIGCEKDHKQALYHCEIAARNDHKLALLALTVFCTEQKDYDRASDLIKKMIALDFGKDSGEEEALRWIDQLGLKHPSFFLNKVDTLREKILTFC